MSGSRSEFPDLRTASVEQITEAFARGVRATLRAHKSAGHSVVVWDRETDRIIVLRPDQIRVSDGRDLTAGVEAPSESAGVPDAAAPATNPPGPLPRARGFG